jgi:hypothetical protein
VECFFRKAGRGYSLSLVNLASPQPLHWNEEHPAPEVKQDFIVGLQLDKPIERIWLVSPDLDSVSPQALKFESAAGRLEIKVPRLDLWDVLLFETKQP